VPELYRLQGICLLRLNSGNREAAMSSLQMAVDIAKQQKASLFQLKAAINIAEAASSTGQPERGLQPLRDLRANLPDGFDAQGSRKLNDFCHPKAAMSDSATAGEFSSEFIVNGLRWGRWWVLRIRW